VVAWRLPTWRGRQYSLALFPLWITAVSGAVANAAWGRPLAFLVTPKIRQSGAPLRLVWPQLVAMAVLTLDIVVGLGHLLARSVPAGSVPAGVIVNVLWSCYDLVTMSVILRAATYRPGRPRRRALRPGSPRGGPRVARPGRRDTGGQHGGQHRDRTGEHRDGAPAGAT
jgi:cellulose synthase (UDP-forming)